MAGSSETDQNAFDVMMGRVVPDLEYDGFPAVGSTYASSLAEGNLLDTLLGENVDPTISYDDFYERYFHHVIGNCEEARFKQLWQTRNWIEDVSATLQRENSYVGVTVQGRGLGACITYDDYTSTQLKAFVLGRGLRDPYTPGLSLKYYYIKVLEEADKGSHFRFMDLPPEMRLSVYRELLILEKCRGTGARYCWPEVLQTCREIHAEANSVLYDENTIKCRFDVTKDYEGSTSRFVKVHDRSFRAGCDHATFQNIPDGIDDYPAFFRHISCLKLKIKFFDETIDTDDGATNSFYPLNHYLYTLASFLMDGHRLRKLDIEAHIDPDLDESCFGPLLYPLRRLRNIESVSITGVPLRYVTKVIQNMRGHEPVFNTLRQWKLAFDESLAQLELLDDVNSNEGCACGDCDENFQQSEIRGYTMGMERIKPECCFSSAMDERVVKNLGFLRRDLANIETARLRELVDAVVSKRAAWVEYDSASRGGTLADNQTKLESTYQSKFGRKNMHRAMLDDWRDEDHAENREPTAALLSCVTTAATGDRVVSLEDSESGSVETDGDEDEASVGSVDEQEVDLKHGD